MAVTNQIGSTLDRAELSPLLSDRYALRWHHAALCAGFTLLFMYLNHLPLYAPATWHHASYGRWILTHGSLPNHDPLLPLADGMYWQSTSWLAEAGFAWLEKQFGPTMLSNVLALTGILTLVLWSRAWYLLSRSLRATLIATAGLVVLGWRELSVLSPQIIGGLCLALLFWMLVRSGAWNRRSAALHEPEEKPVPLSLWIGVPLLMALWVNLDGSFLLGMLVLIASTVDQVFEKRRSTGCWASVFGDRRLRSWIWLTELAFVSTLLNPYGLDRWAAALRTESNPFAMAIGGYSPLVLASWTGAAFAVLWLGIGVTLRRSRNPLRWSEIALLGAVSLAVAFNASLMRWLAPLAITFIVSQTAKRRPAQAESSASGSAQEADARKPLRFAFALVCVLLIWCGFAFSPISTPLLAGKPRGAQRLYDARLPRALSAFLRESRPKGLVWAPSYWADWLQWDASADLQLFANSNFSRLPHQVRKDYWRISRAEGDWNRTLTRYGIATLVLDKRSQRAFSRMATKQDSDWRKVYEDEQSIVLARKES